MSQLRFFDSFVNSFLGAQYGPQWMRNNAEVTVRPDQYASDIQANFT